MPRSRSRSRSRGSSPRRPRGSRSRSPRSPPRRVRRRSLSPGTDFSRARRSLSRDRDGQKSKYPSRVVGVFNLPRGLEEADLEDLFHRYGKTVSVQIIRDRNSSSKGFGFVEFEHLEDARDAKEGMHGRDIKGYSIRTDYSFGKTTRRAPEPDADRGRGSRPGPYDRPSGSSRGYDRDRCDRNRDRDRRSRSRSRSRSR
eukprot:EG_transcript_23784